MLFFRKIKKVLCQPAQFFSKVKSEKLGEPFCFYLVLLLLSSLVPAAYYSRQFQISWKWFPVSYSLALAIGVIGFFAYSGIAHGSLRLLGGAGQFKDTVKGYAYGASPSLLWGIPGSALLFLNNTAINIIFVMVSLGAWAYSVYLSVIGFSLLHRLSRERALLGFLSPYIVAAGAMLIIFLIFLTAVIFAFIVWGS